MATYHFSIVLSAKNPAIKREFTVPDWISFADFHAVIQSVMGWENYHLYSFSWGKRGFETRVEAQEDFWGDSFETDALDAAETCIADYLTEPKQTLLYTYDFGDNWEHKLTLKKILPEETEHARVLKGVGACPPEDCGNLWGYADILEAINNPKHPEHNEWLEWMGLDKPEDWNPDFYDIEAVNLELKNLPLVNLKAENLKKTKKK